METKLYYITGTYHGSHVYAGTEGQARALFHKRYSGESIIHVSCNGKVLQDYE